MEHYGAKNMERNHVRALLPMAVSSHSPDDVILNLSKKKTLRRPKVAKAKKDRSWRMDLNETSTANLVDDDNNHRPKKHKR